MTPALEARSLTKHETLTRTDFELQPGEVLAIVGGAGAGTSALVKALSGATRVDKGTLLVNGHEKRFRTPADARRSGIETVHHPPALAPTLDVAENFYLGRERTTPRLDKKTMREQAATALEELGIGVPPRAGPPLTAGEATLIAMARAATFATTAVLMDNPTATLDTRDTTKALTLITGLRDKGRPVALTSNNLPQVFEIADRVHVQRQGRRAALLNPRTHSMAAVLGLLTGELEMTPEGTIEETNPT